MDTNPLVSVIIPVYNGEKYITQAINSVLSQDYDPIELIVIDDGSIDDTKNQVMKFGNQIRYFYQRNCGQSIALNLGLDHTKGDYISFLDSDDYWTKHKLKNQIEIFKKDPDLDMVYGFIQQFISEDLSLEEQKSKACPTDPQPGFHRSTLVAKKQSIFKVGYFSEQYEFGEFIDWHRRAMDIGLKFFMDHSVSTFRRIHNENLGLKKYSKRNDIVKVLKHALDSRRRNENDS